MQGEDTLPWALVELGELAVLCPACPHPKINLPKNWDTCSEDMKYISAST